MAFPLAGILGGIGLVSQIFGNQGAQGSANNAQNQQNALIQQQVQMLQKRWQIAMDMLNQGAFNPEKQIAAANALSLQEQGVAQNNAAASNRVLGYKPGDTAPIRNQEAIKERYRASRESNNFNIANSLRMQELAAFDPSIGSALNPGIQSYGNQANMYRGQIQPLGPAIANLGEFFPKPKGFKLFG